VRWHQAGFEVTEKDRASQVAGLGFDASGWEIWPNLSAGARVHMVREEMRLSAAGLREWLIDEGITICFLPTPLAERVLAMEWPRETELRYLLTGGDELHSWPGAEERFVLVNNYGPTESSVVASSGKVKGGGGGGGGVRRPTIGRPIANTEVYVVDRHWQAVPQGVRGELCIGGAGLARGYRDRADLTGERFVPDEVSGKEGKRLYRSGDMVRWGGGGELEYEGRKDNQVKIRGNRIELGEIEGVLGSTKERENAQ